MSSRTLVSFTRYAATVKNLRGVLIADPHDASVHQFMKWLSRRFRYRNIGVPPSLASTLPREALRRPFIELWYPSTELEKLPREIAQELSVPHPLVEALVMASLYISPGILVSETLVPHLERLSIETLRVDPAELTTGSVKLHMRIADYTILDMYTRNLELLETLWRREVEPKVFAEHRRALAREDLRRYWRLKKGDRLFLAYADLVNALANTGALRKILAKPFEEIGAALALVPTVVLHRELLSKR